MNYEHKAARSPAFGERGGLQRVGQRNRVSETDPLRLMKACYAPI